MMIIIYYLSTGLCARAAKSHRRCELLFNESEEVPFRGGKKIRIYNLEKCNDDDDDGVILIYYNTLARIRNNYFTARANNRDNYKVIMKSKENNNNILVERFRRGVVSLVAYKRLREQLQIFITNAKIE